MALLSLRRLGILKSGSPVSGLNYPPTWESFLSWKQLWAARDRKQTGRGREQGPSAVPSFMFTIPEFEFT